MPGLAYITLALVPGIGRARIDTLLGRFGSADAVLAASLQELDDVPGISLAAATAIRHAPEARAQKLLDELGEVGGVALAPDDDGFPSVLRDIPDPPALLFIAGQLAALSGPAVAMVGSRSHTRYGAEVCRHLAGGAARHGLVVVSGMARGIDAIAHDSALNAGGTTIGVLGNGFGVIYPSANRGLYERVLRDGCLVTEYPPGERPSVGSFQRRNRLISGLARATVVIEARDGSGALITVDCALSQGREVLAVPGPITSPVSNGCNRLIQHGAKPALGLRDVLEECGMKMPNAAAIPFPTDLSPDEQRVLQLLSLGTEQVDEIARRTRLGTAETLAALTSLEIRGVAVQEPGMTFRATIGIVTGPGRTEPPVKGA